MPYTPYGYIPDSYGPVTPEDLASAVATARPPSVGDYNPSVVQNTVPVPGFVGARYPGEGGFNLDWIRGNVGNVDPYDMTGDFITGAALALGGAGLAGALGGAGSAAAGTDALTGVSLPASAVPIGAGTSVDALAAGGLASLPAGLGAAAGAAGGAGVAGGLGSRILGALGGSSGNPWLTIGQIGASLIGGDMASDAAENASEAQLAAAREALDYQRETRDLALGLVRPDIEASQTALGRMLDMTGTPRPESLGESQPFDITQDPSYQFRLNEGMKALENSAAARGGLLSGGFAKKALRYAQDYASTEYQNIYNRLASIANRTPVGNSGANIALNFGSNAGNTAIASGDARASGYIAQGNAWANAMNQIALALGRNFGQPAGG